MAGPAYPAAAITWLCEPALGRVLVIGASGPAATMAADAGHEVVVVDRDEAAIARLVDRRPDINGVVAQAESLPFEPLRFDTVLCVQNLHRFAPGLVLAEFARVLGRDGCIAIAYLGRDDTVPWVKRLTATVQARLPQAMRGDYGDVSVEAIEASHYFPQVQLRTYRLWVPCVREELREMATTAAGANELSPEDLAALKDEVGAVYDASARPPEPLQLPYRLRCWRAQVDHNELTNPIRLTDDALHISL